MGSIRTGNGTAEFSDFPFLLSGCGEDLDVENGL